MADAFSFFSDASSSESTELTRAPSPVTRSLPTAAGWSSAASSPADFLRTASRLGVSLAGTDAAAEDTAGTGRRGDSVARGIHHGIF